MKTVQLKLKDNYHEKMQSFCRQFGTTKTELVRFMLDTMENWGITEDEFNNWYDSKDDT